MRGWRVHILKGACFTDIRHATSYIFCQTAAGSHTHAPSTLHRTPPCRSCPLAHPLPDGYPTLAVKSVRLAPCGPVLRSRTRAPSCTLVILDPPGPAVRHPRTLSYLHTRSWSRSLVASWTRILAPSHSLSRKPHPHVTCPRDLAHLRKPCRPRGFTSVPSRSLATAPSHALAPCPHCPHVRTVPALPPTLATSPSRNHAASDLAPAPSHSLATAPSHPHHLALSHPRIHIHAPSYTRTVAPSLNALACTHVPTS